MLVIDAAAGGPAIAVAATGADITCVCQEFTEGALTPSPREAERSSERISAALW